MPDAVLPDTDSRGRTTQSSRTLSSGPGPLTPPLPSTSPSQMVASPILRRDKSLPPLPGEVGIEFPNVNAHPLPESRPQTVFTYDPRSMVGGLSPPQAPFRTAEARRQSFSGIGSKGHFSHTMPGRGAYGRTMSPLLAEEKYGEFGIQPSGSVGQWSGAQFSQGSLQVPGEKMKKRKSKFGLAALFGKKTHETSGQVEAANGSMYSRPSHHSEMPYEGMMAGGASSGQSQPRPHAAS